jgi:hypothetical protein
MNNTKDRVIKTLEDIVAQQDQSIEIMREIITQQDRKLASELSKKKFAYPQWLWYAIYFLAGIGFWELILLSIN